ncbi:methyltransferase domain-containing protein [Candidatus Woesearchaeota archaeon]|nr:methyltransferase domain-containing protein [Candidatus Woesearchaeota archaeon]
MTKTEEHYLYKKTLEKYFDLNKYKIKENPSILNIGCGKGWDMKAQKEHLKAKTILGIDDNIKSIEKAKKSFSKKEEFHFETENALFLNYFIMMDFDIIFCSHPEVWHRNNVWKEIFEKASLKLKENGYMISTFYTEKEMNITKEILEGLDYEIKTAEKNPYSVKIPGYKFKRHDYILVAEKNQI